MASICLQSACVSATGICVSNRIQKNGGKASQAVNASSYRSHLNKLQVVAPFAGCTDGFRVSSKPFFQKTRPLSGTIRAAVGTVVTEPSTSIQFSSTITAPGGSKELTLLGAGVREKKIVLVNVKVYAVGLYFDPSFTSQGALAEFKGKDLSSDAAFFKALAEVPVEKSIEIVLARDVDGETFWKALNESLAPRLKGEGAEALATFGEVLKTRNLKQNTGIYLTWSQPSTLQVGISDDATTLKTPTETVASIESAPLLSALFDVYLGTDSVSVSAKSAVAKSTAGLL